MGSRCASTLVAALLGLAQIVSAQSPVERPPLANGVTFDAVVATLQSNGFQAKPLDTPPTNELVLGQIVTGISGVNVLISVFKCPNSSTAFVCGLAFAASFKDANLTESAIGSLNASSFVKVQQSAGNGKDAGLRVTYVYPCEGFEDPKFVPMVLKNFGSGVTSVIAAYKKLQQSSTPSTPQAKPP